MRKVSLFIVLILFSLNAFAGQKPTLIFYCGTTMVKPIAEIANVIERKHDCKIRIVQGSSKDLYNIFINLLKFSKYPDIAKDLMSYAVSKEGKEIMKKHGFLD